MDAYDTSHPLGNATFRVTLRSAIAQLRYLWAIALNVI